MNKKTVNTALIVFSTVMLIAGTIFLVLSIAREENDTTYLAIALANILLANIFNFIREMIERKNKQIEKGK